MYEEFSAADSSQKSSGTGFPRRNPFDDPLIAPVRTVTPSTDRVGQGPRSPFSATFQLEDPDLDSESREDLALFMNELHDEELDHGLADLISYAEEATDIARREAGLSEGELGTVEPLREEFELLISEIEEFVDGLAGRLGEIDADAMDVGELEALVDGYEPQFEASIWSRIKKKVRGATKNVAGAVKKVARGAKKVAAGVRKKARKVVGRVARGAKRAARSVAQTVAKGVGALANVGKWAKKLGLGKLLKLIMSRLKEHVGPFIRLALCAAMDKVPKSLRKHAERLKGKVENWLEKNELGETASVELDTAAVDPSDLQTDLDVRLSQLVFGELEDEADWELRRQAYARLPELAGPDGSLETLTRARTQLAEEIASDEVEDYGPRVEKFVATIWPALKGGVMVGGRKRVVGLISRKLVAPLISKLFAKGGPSGRKIGKVVARPLGDAITSSGLRLLGLELNEEDKTDAAAQMVVGLVEDTARRVAAMPDEMENDEAAMEAFALQAFEAAAAANLPDLLPDEVYEARPELREARRHKGCWLPMPLRSQRRGGRVKYRKYSATPEVALNEETMSRLRTSCGRSLKTAIRGHLASRWRNGLRARVHLYEAVPGTTPGRLHALEVELDEAEGDYTLHPLTPEAAEMLIGDGRLGRPVALRNRCHRRRMGVGQRFYRLEFLDEMPLAGELEDEVGDTLRGSQVFARFDFAREAIAVFVYIDEAEAAAIAGRLGAGDGPGVVLARLRDTWREGLEAALSGDFPGHAHLVHPALSRDQARGEAFGWLPRETVANVMTVLGGWIERGITDLIRQDRGAIMEAAAAPRFGATFETTIRRPAGLSRLYEAFDGQPVKLFDLLLEPACDRISSKVVAGFYRD